jgi:hypothetical protein
MRRCRRLLRGLLQVGAFELVWHVDVGWLIGIWCFGMGMQGLVGPFWQAGYWEWSTLWICRMGMGFCR